MKSPVYAIVGNLSFCTDGTVWATWSVDPQPFLHASVEEKVRHHRAVYTALSQMEGETIIESICAARDLDLFEEAMRRTSGLPLWQRYVEATIDELGDAMLFHRTYWVTAQLGAASVRSSLGSLRSGLLGGIPGTQAPPTKAEINGRARKAAEVQMAWSAVGVQPGTAAEVAWLMATKLRKGTGAEPIIPRRSTDSYGSAMLASIFDVELLEGGDKHDKDRGWNRNYLRVTTNRGHVAYQAHVAMARVPARFVYPGGGEWLLAADQMWLPVDWHVRVHPVENQRAQGTATRRLKTLADSHDQTDDRIEGATPQLLEATRQIGELRADLAANPSDPELEVGMWFTVAAPTISELEEQYDFVDSTFGGDYGVGRPTGAQLGLLRSSMPGTRADTVLTKDYRQHCMPSTLAMAGMFGMAELGSRKGILIGTHVDSGLQGPVLLDPSEPTAELNMSGSIAIIGAPGAGKGVLTKQIVFGTAYAGGRVLVLDRNGEYQRVAAAMQGIDARVIHLDIASAPTLDPFVVDNDPIRAARTAAGVLSTLTGKGGRSGSGAAMREACEKVASERNPRIHLVLGVLQTMADSGDQHAVDALGALRGFRAMGDLFDPARPAPRLDGALTVWRTALALPTEAEMLKEHLMAALPDEKIEGLARLYLITAASRIALLSDPAQFAMLAIADAYALMTTEGQQLCTAVNLEGRKGNAALLLDSQSESHFSETITEHMPIRFVGRTGNLDAARRHLRFVGVDDDQEMAEALIRPPGGRRGWPAGRFIHRDARGRTGILQVVMPRVPELAEAFSTTPKGAV